MIISSYDENCASLLGTIIPHSERWHSVSFNLSPSTHAVPASVGGRLPALTRYPVNFLGAFMASLPYDSLPWSQLPLGLAVEQSETPDIPQLASRLQNHPSSLATLVIRYRIYKPRLTDTLIKRLIDPSGNDLN